MRRVGIVLSVILISVLIMAMTAWGALALYYSDLPDNVRVLTACFFAVLGVAVLAWYFFSKRSWRPLIVFAIGFALLLSYWSTIEPKQDRDWAPEYARLRLCNDQRRARRDSQYSQLRLSKRDRFYAPLL